MDIVLPSHPFYDHISTTLKRISSIPGVVTLREAAKPRTRRTCICQLRHESPGAPFMTRPYRGMGGNIQAKLEPHSILSPQQVSFRAKPRNPRISPVPPRCSVNGNLNRIYEPSNHPMAQTENRVPHIWRPHRQIWDIRAKLEPLSPNPHHPVISTEAKRSGEIRFSTPTPTMTNP